MFTIQQQTTKRFFDITLSLIGLVMTGWLIALMILAARRDTRKSGVFRQLRVGRHGKLFHILKIRTMRDVSQVSTHVTVSGDPRITKLGKWLRITKADELPQLWNILRGEMSFVGPRPDVPEIASRLHTEAPEVLELRPGITGPASLKYRDEAEILTRQEDPERFNSEVIYPDKIRINKLYVSNYTFWNDMKILWLTVSGLGLRACSADFSGRECNAQAAA